MSREKKELIRVQLYHRLKRREMDWHARRAWHVDPPLLNEWTIKDALFERAMQLTARILGRRYAKPHEKRELVQISRRLEQPVNKSGGMVNK